MARPINPVKYWLGKKMSEEHREKINKANMGRKFSLESRKKISESMKGNTNGFKKGEKHPPMTKETRLKIGLTGLGRKPWNKGLKGFNAGEKSHLWKGGITPINKKIRESFEYKLWREAVFERDDFTCVWCGKKGEKLNADHIKPFALYPELRFAIDNGRTLCVVCHKTTDTYGRKSN